MDTTSRAAYRCYDDEIAGAVNLRDLGGTPTAAGRVRHGLLFRSGITHCLGEDGLRTLRERLGLRLVIDLRSEEECAGDGVAPFAAAGIARRHIPVVGSTALTPEELRERWERMRRLEHDWAESYLTIVSQRQEAYRAFFETLAEEGALPALFHCTGGRDRTGIAAALLLSALGTPRAVIIEDYARTGRHLAPHVHRFGRQLQTMGMTAEEFRRVLETPAAPMAVFLAALDREYGSPLGYLEGIGVKRALLGQLEAQLVER